MLYYLVFHRHTPLDIRSIERLHALHTECIESFGVFIALPESILLFQLIGLEYLLYNRPLGTTARNRVMIGAAL